MSLCPYLFICAGSICFYGGYWQTYRREEKIKYLQYVKDRFALKPIPCPTKLTEKKLEELRLSLVYVEGTPDFKNEVVVGPDPPPKSSGIHNVEYEWGGYVYTPFTLKTGETILLNRGWIEEDYALECPEPSETNKISDNLWRFEGILNALEFVPEQFDPFDVGQIFWPFIHRLSINTRWESIQIPRDEVPVVVTLTKPNKDNMPVRITEKDFMGVKVSPSQHFSYIIFWYSMCAISWFYAYRFFRNPTARTLFKPKFKKWRPVLRRSDVLRMPDRDLRKL